MSPRQFSGHGRWNKPRASDTSPEFLHRVPRAMRNADDFQRLRATANNQVVSPHRAEPKIVSRQIPAPAPQGRESGQSCRLRPDILFLFVRGSRIILGDERPNILKIALGLNIDPAGKVTNAPAADKTITAKLTKSTGEWKGTFTHSDGKKPAWQAATFQKAGSHQGGHGFFLSLPAKPADGDAVSIQAK